MIKRLVNPLKSNSFFLFGARGTGKSTLLEHIFDAEETIYIDLLDPNEEGRLNRNPNELLERIKGAKPKIKWIIIDEIQKVPKLLDVIHSVIGKIKLKFVLTGSSARKLKRGAADLQAGRAFVYHLYPFTVSELGASFDLNDALNWGTLPGLLPFKTDREKAAFLRAYGHTYLKEEVQVEQLVRHLDPFRNFLEVASQCNGEIINYSRIAEEVGVDTKTIQSYFSILEDTLIGFYLPAYHRSLRKQQKKAPKFFLFDCGVKKALDRTLGNLINERTYGYGKVFEHFIILELVRLNSYLEKDWKFSYFRTRDGAEIDLIIDRPGKPLALVEIKSTEKVTNKHISFLSRFASSFTESEAFCISRDRVRKKSGPVLCFHWTDTFKELGLTDCWRTSLNVVKSITPF